MWQSLLDMRSDPVLEADVTKSDIIGMDRNRRVSGRAVIRCRIKERISGIDLLQKLLHRSETRGFRPYFLGATPEILAKARATVSARRPAIRFAGTRNGYLHRQPETRKCR